MLRKRQVDYVYSASSTQYSVSKTQYPNIRDRDVLRLMPTLFVHRSDRFRPISVEQALEHCFLVGRNIADFPPPITLDLLYYLEQNGNDLEETMLQPAASILTCSDQWMAPIYVATETYKDKPDEGQIVITFLWNACIMMDNHCCVYWNQPAPSLFDVRKIAFDIFFDAEDGQWKTKYMRIPSRNMLLTTIPEALYIEKDTHRILVDPPSWWTRWRYSNLWKPILCYENEYMRWKQIRNFSESF